MPAMPMAESKPPMVVGMRQTNRATITVTDIVATPEYRAIGTKVTQAKRKTKREAGEQNVERDFVGSLLPLGSFHQGDHAIQERLSWARRDAYHDAIGQYFCSTGYGRTVTAGSRE